METVVNRSFGSDGKGSLIPFEVGKEYPVLRVCDMDDLEIVNKRILYNAKCLAVREGATSKTVGNSTFECKSIKKLGEG